MCTMEQFVTAYIFFEFCDGRERERKKLECDCTMIVAVEDMHATWLYSTSIQTVEDIHPTIGIMFHLTKKSLSWTHIRRQLFFMCIV